MSLGFADVLSCHSLQEARLVAGAAGIERNTVSSVTVGEVPDIGEWLSGGELILSTFFATTSDSAEQVEFVRRIVKGGAAGLIAKPGRYIGALDPAIVELADNSGFPIFEVPSEVRWTHIIQEVTDRLLGDHVAFMRRSEHIHKRLLGVVMEGGGMERLVTVSSELLERPVTFFDDLGRIIASSEPEIASLVDDRQIKVPALPSDSTETVEVTDQRQVWAFKPVLTAGAMMGSIAVIVGPSPLNDLDIRAFEHTVTVAAVEQGRLRILLETEMRMRGDLLDDLLSGRIKENSAIVARFARLSCDLSHGGTVIIARATATDDDDEASPASIVGSAENVRSDIVEAATRVVSSRHPHSLVLLKRGDVVAILSGDESPGTSPGRQVDADAMATAGRLAQEMRRILPNGDVRIAVGRVRDSAQGIAASYREAETALRLGALRGGEITSFDDVGSYKLLMSLLERDPREMEEFYRDTIDPIIEYDAKHETTLVETLGAYFECNENIAAAAGQLYTHRHTVRYRLGRIADITGLDLSIGDHRERLSLGLKIHRLRSGLI